MMSGAVWVRHLRRRDRRGLALLVTGQADRLRRSRAADQSIGRALGDRALSKAGSRTLRWAAVEAANQAWRPSNPWHGYYLRVAARHGKNPAKSAVARKLLIAAWHMLSRQEPFKQPASVNSGCFLTA
jgi:transposase